MYKIQVKLDLDMSRAGTQEKQFMDEVGHIGVFETLLVSGMQSLYPQGIPMSKGKVLARLQRRFDECEKNVENVTIEDAEFDLIKSVFKNDDVKFQPGQYRPVMSILDNIEAATKVEKPKKP